jgi:hypothetical protein
MSSMGKVLDRADSESLDHLRSPKLFHIRAFFMKERLPLPQDVNTANFYPHEFISREYRSSLLSMVNS